MTTIDKTFDSREYFSSVAKNLSDRKPRKTFYDGVELSLDPLTRPDLEGVRLFAEAIVGKRRVAPALGFAPLLGLFFRKSAKSFMESDLVKKMVSWNLAENLDEAASILHSLRDQEHKTYGYRTVLKFIYDKIPEKETRYTIGISAAPLC